MTDTMLCNSTSVSASAIADDSDAGLVWERVVTLCLGIIEDDASQEIAAGIMLTAEQARSVAQELLAAADVVDSPALLPVNVLIETAVPIGRC